MKLRHGSCLWGDAPPPHPRYQQTCSASHVGFLFVLEVSKQNHFFVHPHLILTTTKPEKTVVDDD